MRGIIPYITNNIIIGYGEVPAIRTSKGIAWVYPSGELTYNKDEAIALAKRLDSIVTTNLPKYNRRLFKK